MLDPIGKRKSEEVKTIDPVTKPISAAEVEQRLQRNFLERTQAQVQGIRTLVSQRNWARIKSTCEQIHKRSLGFKLNELSTQAFRTANSIPSEMPRTFQKSLPDAQTEIDQLIYLIESMTELAQRSLIADSTPMRVELAQNTKP